MDLSRPRCRQPQLLKNSKNAQNTTRRCSGREMKHSHPLHFLINKHSNKHIDQQNKKQNIDNKSHTKAVEAAQWTKCPSLVLLLLVSITSVPLVLLLLVSITSVLFINLFHHHLYPRFSTTNSSNNNNRFLYKQCFNKATRLLNIKLFIIITTITNITNKPFIHSDPIWRVDINILSLVGSVHNKFRTFISRSCIRMYSITLGMRRLIIFQSKPKSKPI
jgi:hypothetical protein